MAGASERLDLIVRNGRVVDGAGNPWFRADVGIRNGRIAAVGAIDPSRAHAAIDAKGQIVCPGFVDIHNHSDTSVLLKPTCDSHIMQGVTTILVGNCGESGAPLGSVGPAEGALDADSENVRSLAAQGIRWQSFAEYLRAIEQRGVTINVASLVGHHMVRALGVGWEARPASQAELGKMKTLVAQAMDEGAFGLSSGLSNPPGYYANTDELVELTRVVGQRGGFHAIHMRDEHSKQAYRKSVLEGIEIGERSGAPVVINHLETHYPNGGMEPEMLRQLEDARARGVDVLTDVPPTWHASGGISCMLPHWIKDGGFSTMLARFKDPVCRSRVRNDTTSDRGSDGLILVDGYWDQVWVSDCPRNPQFSGKSLADIAHLMGQEPSYLVICDLLAAEGRDLQSNYTAHDEADIQAIVAHPLSMIESDARIPVSTATRVNTRTYTAFPITFRRYVRGETWPDDPQGTARKILTLQEAVRKMTSMPAQRMGLRDRGLVREGMWADLVIFNPDTIADRATASDPHQYPVGIDYVLVNGHVVVEKSKHSGKRPGQVLRHA